MKVFYDLEFYEDGSTIQLISIGMVAEDGREYYAVDRSGPWKLVQRDPWLMANVWPTLPLSAPVPPYPARLNLADPSMRTLDQIRVDVRDFLIGPDLPDPGPVELWAYCGAYDHVRLCQMWGRAVNKPAVVPWWTNDLAQEAQRVGVDLEQLVPRDGGQHNALADARWNRDVYAALEPLSHPLRWMDGDPIPGGFIHNQEFSVPLDDEVGEEIAAIETARPEPRRARRKSGR